MSILQEADWTKRNAPTITTISEKAPLVRLEDVHKSYDSGKAKVAALRGVDLQLADGDFAALAGPSGSGKTTLLNLIGCIDQADRGRIVLDGQDLTRTPLYKLASVRGRKLGFIFQAFNLLPVLTAFENVEYPLLFSGLDKEERHSRVRQWLGTVGLQAKTRQRPDQLSGGERQRVAIARAMVTRPKLVLADEPTANLDSHTATEILDVLKQLNQETGTTFLFSTHDARVVQRAHRVISLEDGLIVNDERLFATERSFARC